MKFTSWTEPSTSQITITIHEYSNWWNSWKEDGLDGNQELELKPFYHSDLLVSPIQFLAGIFFFFSIVVFLIWIQFIDIFNFCVWLATFRYCDYKISRFNESIYQFGQKHARFDSVKPGFYAYFFKINPYSCTTFHLWCLL